MIKSSSPTKQNPLLELRAVTKTYSAGGILFNALDDVSLSISDGEFISITGPSGSGKSTLMHIIGLLDTPTTGEVVLEGRNVAKFKEGDLAQVRNKKLGFVFQQFNLLARTSALENVTLPLLYSDVPKSKRESLGLSMLDRVGLTDKQNNTPAQLSGGQQQRVAIARALINDPKIILADEPTGNLDSKNGQAIMQLLHQLNREDHRTIVFVTHDPDLAKEAHRTVVIRDGKIEGGKQS